ncbi:hypothetical protein DEO27_015665 [Mucilaginibacter rubeus]|uniref:Uncharacterized protein n=1 Tax=Mucilaginibacter rubeus TaxID=2027860 RepID=A0A5C1I0G6_9SPHI|nr:hypothetical protein DEO27_015665 [Mucilaginibacter rubeus]
MRRSIYIYSCSLILFVLTSCAGKQYQVLFEQKTPVTDTASSKSTGDLSSYRIKSQDILQIRNLQNIKYVVDESPSGNSQTNGSGGAGAGQTYQVEEDGTVALPVIGHVAVTGLTRSQAAKLIEDLYRKKLLKDPIIELKITNLKVTLLGEFKGQGNFPLLKDRTTLVEMIGEAGGLSDRANETNIKIIRGDQLNPQVTYINLRDIQSINDPRAILQNGDIIYASQNKRAIRSDKLQNLSTLTQPILLLLNTALVILSLSRR